MTLPVQLSLHSTVDQPERGIFPLLALEASPSTSSLGRLRVSVAAIIVFRGETERAKTCEGRSSLIPRAEWSRALSVRDANAQWTGEVKTESWAGGPARKPEGASTPGTALEATNEREAGLGSVPSHLQAPRQLQHFKIRMGLALCLGEGPGSGPEDEARGAGK